MKEEKKKPTKKRLLLYYLILAVCILIIAAVTVTVVLAVTGRQDNFVIDNTLDVPPAENGDDKDVSTRTEFIFPVKDVNVSQEMDFWHNATLDVYHRHGGVDFKGEIGDEVFAAVDGLITEVVTTSRLSGGYITIAHDNGLFTTYKFIVPDENLKQGQSVSRGQVIGTISEACGEENADGAHLHFEVHEYDKLVNPTAYLKAEEK